MKNNSAMNTHGNNSYGVFVVKPEPTELSYLAQSSECSNLPDQNIFIGENKNGLSQSAIIKNEDVNVISNLKIENCAPTLGNLNASSAIEEQENASENSLAVINSLSNTNHKCGICTKSFEKRRNVVEHMKCHTVERKYKCGICAKCFKMKKHLVIHLQCHVDEKVHKCDICLKSFKTKTHLANHKRYHTDERKHKCDVCMKSFKMKSHLVSHMRCHTDEKNHKYGICTKIYKRCHIDERTHKCDICAKSFKMKMQLVDHMQSHDDERKHKCDICTKYFKTKNHLASHMRYHTVERNHKCDICTKYFKTKNHLESHMRCHTDERNHKCDICVKSFKRRMDMKRHMKHHTDERNFKCDGCAKSFKTRGNLMQHMRCQISVRNQPSNMCTKNFPSKHVEAQFECNSCGICFDHRNHLDHIEQKDCKKMFENHNEIVAEDSAQKLLGSNLWDQTGKQQQSFVEQCNLNIKEETVEIIPGEKLDIPSIPAYESQTAIMGEINRSRNVYKLRQQYKNEIKVKEEADISFMDKYNTKLEVDVKQEIVNISDNFMYQYVIH